MRRSKLSESKWIVGTRPDQKVTQAARLALCQRLSVTQEYIQQAAKHDETEVELVHQLRISTRRSQAALQMFADLLPPLSRDKTIKHMKKLRRAAGHVRDVDVLVQRLSRRAETSSDKRLAGLVECMGHRRQTAESELIEARKKATRKGIEDSIGTLTKDIDWRSEESEPDFATYAESVYHETAGEFLQAATADLSADDSLHQMRLAGKKLRYSLELLAGVFEPEFQTRLYPAVQENQDKLGRINDHVTASLLLDEWRGDFEAEDRDFVSHLAQEERAFAQATGRQFRAWWTQQRIDDLQRLFEQMQTIDELPAPTALQHAGRDSA